MVHIHTYTYAKCYIHKRRYRMVPNFRSKKIHKFRNYINSTKIFLMKIWWALNNLVSCMRQCSRPNEEFVREYFTSHWHLFVLVYMEASHTQVKSHLKGCSSSCHHCTSCFHVLCTSCPWAMNPFFTKFFLVYKFMNLFFTQI